MTEGESFAPLFYYCVKLLYSSKLIMYNVNKYQWRGVIPLTGAGFEKVSLGCLPPIACSCGMTRRAFADSPDSPASVHLLYVSKDAKTHWHEKFTEIYTVLEGEGGLELDGELVHVKPLDSVMIKPGTRHRAVGRLTVLNVAVPRFDPTDEHYE